MKDKTFFCRDPSPIQELSLPGAVFPRLVMTEDENEGCLGPAINLSTEGYVTLSHDDPQLPSLKSPRSTFVISGGSLGFTSFRPIAICLALLGVKNVTVP